MAKKFLDLKLFGNWTKAKMDLAKLPADIRSSAKYGQQKAARELVKIVKGHIMNQDLGWVAKARPAKSGSTKSLIDTSTYLNAITYWQKDYAIQVGVKRGLVEPRTKVEVALVALIHERGGKGVPMRPLWGPSMEEMGGPKGIRNTISKSVKAKLKSRMGSGPWQTSN